jgi:hypothetical protein
MRLNQSGHKGPNLPIKWADQAILYADRLRIPCRRREPLVVTICQFQARLVLSSMSARSLNNLRPLPFSRPTLPALTTQGTLSKLNSRPLKLHMALQPH